MISDTNLVAGLPQHFQCYTAYRAYPASVRPGEDFDLSPTTRELRERFLMTLQEFASPDPVQGLLMYAHERPPRGFMATNPLPAVQTQRYFYFFGYHCGQCQQVFLVPQWVRSVEEDLPRALRHACMGDGSVGWAERQIRAMADEATAVVCRRLDNPSATLAPLTISLIHRAMTNLAEEVREFSGKITAGGGPK